MSENTRSISPARNILGSLAMPGDKSISHRYALLAGLAEGTSRYTNFSSGADPSSSLGCVAQLGAQIQKNDDGSVSITGGGGRFIESIAPLDCGNSGSTMRMLAGLIAGQAMTVTLTGDASLSIRPMERIRKPLEQMGARVELIDGHAPMTVRGGSLRAITYLTPVPSAQVKSAVLFAGLHADGTTTVEESVRTRDHSEIALRAFGAQLDRNGNKVSVSGGEPLRAFDARVPGDLSSAAFFLCAASLFPDSSLVFDGVGMNPTRATLLDVLASLGARTRVLDLNEVHGELVGTIQIAAPPQGLSRAIISGALAAQLIDELPVLAAIGPYTREGIRIRDARELRVKESDRIALVAKNLRAMGAQVAEYDDGLDVPGDQQLHGAEIDSGGDHRIAMAFSIAALRATGDTLIHGAEHAAISFPEFFDFLDRVCER
jgi:3-phosphoshikimate 1-carboxyvinyltransferase